MVLRPGFTLKSSQCSLNNTHAQALLSETKLQLVPVGPMQCGLGKFPGARFCGCHQEPVPCRPFVPLRGLYVWLKPESKGYYQYWQWSSEIPRSSERKGRKCWVSQGLTCFPWTKGNSTDWSEGLALLKPSLKPGPRCLFHSYPRRHR